MLPEFQHKHNITLMIEELKNKISAFESGINVFSDEGLYESLLDIVLLIKIPSKLGDWKIGTFPMMERTYPKGTKFTRIRKLDYQEHNFIYGDFWEAPERSIKAGRLNRKSEPLLYISQGEFMSPIKEAGIETDDKFIIMFYEAKCNITVTEIGWKTLESETHGEIGILIKDFLDRNFSKKGSDAYRLSEVIAKRINKSEAQGWCYPSVAREGGTNICLYIENKNMLDLFGVLCCKIVKDGTLNFDEACDFNIRENITRIRERDKVQEKVEEIYNRFRSDIDDKDLTEIDKTPKLQMIQT